MRQISIKRESKAFHAAMVLLVMVIITLAAVIGSTWASSSADHILTYTTNKLAWDSGTDVRSDGSAELTVFSTSYQNVKSSDDSKVIAPGTTQSDSIVLRNTVDRAITYTAIAYYIKNDSRIPVDMEFDGTGLSDTSSYTLPSGIEKKDVLRAVSGKVAAKSEQDFNFNWEWSFETGNLSTDLTDTELGDDAADGKDENVKVGFYIVVQDTGASKHTVKPVKTGDTANIRLYAALAAACILVMILLLFTGRKKDRDDQDKGHGNDKKEKHNS